MLKINTDTILAQIESALEKNDINAAMSVLEALRTPDQADIFYELEDEDKITLLPYLDPSVSADILEEMEDLPGPTQSNILRLLETGEMHRIGSNRVIRPNVRILSATAAPLDILATQGGIRKSLLYRLEGVRVNMPPLRERPEDIRD